MRAVGRAGEHRAWQPHWLREVGYPGLLVALIAQIVVDPLLEGTIGERVVPFFYLLTLAAVLLVSSPSPRVLRLGLLLATVPVVAVMVQLLLPEVMWSYRLTLVSVGGAYFVAALSVMRDVMRGDRVSGDTVMGALAAYLLFGLAWAFLYTLLYSLDPGSFRLAEVDAAGVEGVRGATDTFEYFSFITLTTLGYGDVVPVSSTARTVAVSQATFGQLYIAVVLARLVALELQGRRTSS